jgi:hypothetical protein
MGTMGVLATAELCAGQRNWNAYKIIVNNAPSESSGFGGTMCGGMSSSIGQPE